MSDEQTGVPALRTWPRVYAFVVAVVVLWMTLLTIIMRTFS
jgi:hypothetical protein